MRQRDEQCALIANPESRRVLRVSLSIRHLRVITSRSALSRIMRTRLMARSKFFIHVHSADYHQNEFDWHTVKVESAWHYQRMRKRSVTRALFSFLFFSSQIYFCLHELRIGDIKIKIGLRFCTMSEHMRSQLHNAHVLIPLQLS